MTLYQLLLAYASAGLFISAILYVAFGQITVRKLRKNPKIKDALGIEFVSGMDIFNVASAFARPKWFTKKIKQMGNSFLVADAEILYKYTTPFDRILAKILFWLSFSSTVFLMVFVFLDDFGFWGK